MSICKNKFGTYDGFDVYEYTLENKSGLCVSILNLGGIVRSLVYRGTDVVLGRDSVEEYADNDGYYGALIGRNSNRIENAEFSLNGKTYKLCANDGRNNLHGGKCGFDKKIWNVCECDVKEPSLILTTQSCDGEEGFPGNADIKVTYTVTEDNALRIHYEAVCDADTVMNMTNHSYFNLNGHANGAVDGHKLWIDSCFYTPNTDDCVPNGEILSVKDTPFDFGEDKTLGERFASEHSQKELFGGFDHNFVLNGSGYRKVASLTGDISCITMEVYTDQSGIQLYTGNGIVEDRVCKGGFRYVKHGALCLETQAFPNNLKYPHFQSAVLKKGEKYDTVTEYRFI